DLRRRLIFRDVRVSRRLPTLASLAALAVACADPANAERPAVARLPVVGGEVSPAGGPAGAGPMLRTRVDDAEPVWTASLVAPNLVVTARHCVSHFVQGNFGCTVQGELQSVDPGAGSLGAHLDASSIEFYDGSTPRTEPIAYGQEVLSTLAETICMND